MTARIIHPIFDSSPRLRPFKIGKNRSKAIRQLFPVDHDETRRFLETEFEKEQLQASQVWDFDFTKGIPIKDSGNRYEWTQMSLVFAPRRPKKPEPEPDITELYASPLPTRVEDDLLSENDEEKRDQKPEEKQEQNDEEKLKNKQTKITDFMAIRKRNRESISKKPTESVIPSKISKYNDVTS